MRAVNRGNVGAARCGLGGAGFRVALLLSSFVDVVYTHVEEVHKHYWVFEVHQL